ncbi:hypothetical protein LCGC14_0350700, partial [marine sediment metagenome]
EQVRQAVGDGQLSAQLLYFGISTCPYVVEGEELGNRNSGRRYQDPDPYWDVQFVACKPGQRVYPEPDGSPSYGYDQDPPPPYRSGPVQFQRFPVRVLTRHAPILPRTMQEVAGSAAACDIMVAPARERV